MDDATSRAKAYVDQMRSNGHDDAAISAAMVRAGWRESQIVALLGPVPEHGKARPRSQQPPVHAGTCPYCRNMIKITVRYVQCTVCKTPHHEECWEANGGCTIYGCTSVRSAPVGGEGESGGGASCTSYTGIHEAAKLGDAPAIRGFLAAGVPVDARDEGGRTALHWAAEQGMTETMSLLITRGADVRADTPMGFTPLHYAVAGGHLEAVKILLARRANANTKSDLLGTPLHIAIVRGNAPAARELLRHGAKVDEEDDGSPLHLASVAGKAEIVQLLLKMGGDVGTTDKRGDTPLHIAAGLGHTTIAKLLLDHKAKVNARGNHEATPLHRAADQADIVQLLLSAGADVDAPHRLGGWTPLHTAAILGHATKAEVLLRAGADPQRKGADGNTPLDLALQEGKAEVAELLRGSARRSSSSKAVLGSINSGIPGLAAANQGDTLREAIDAGADPNARNEAGMNGLHLAAIRGAVRAAQVLAQNGGDVTARDMTGKTPLHLAAMHGQILVAQVLLDAGADPNARDNKGITALHSAAMVGSAEVVMLLLRRGGNPRARENSGYTPSDFAVAQGHDVVAGLLRQHGA